MNLNKLITMSGWKLVAGLLLFWSTGASMGQISPDHVWPFLRPLAHHLHSVANFVSIVSCFMLVWASRREKPATHQ